MRVRWTIDATDDLEQRSPRNGLQPPAELPSTSFKALTPLTRFRTGAARVVLRVHVELVLSPLPFVAVYEVHEHEVQVLRLLHGAPKMAAGIARV